MGFWGLVTWAVLGLLGLVLQTVYVFKDPLATYHPRLKPLLLEAMPACGLPNSAAAKNRCRCH
jgi:hypothetical protein